MQGCELRNSEHPLHTPDGVAVVSFLFNPHTNGFVPIHEDEIDIILSPSAIAHWETRLGIKIGKDP